MARRKRLVERLWAVRFETDGDPFFGYGDHGKATFHTEGAAEEYIKRCVENAGPLGEAVPVEVRELPKKRKAAKVCKKFGDAAMLARFGCHDERDRKRLVLNAVVSDEIAKNIRSMKGTK